MFNTTPASSATDLSARTTRRALDWPRLVLVLSLGLGIIIRLRQYIVVRSLWLDEAMLARNIINRSAIELLRPLDYQQSAPIAYLMLTRLAVVLGGPGELMLRAVSLISGIAALLLFAAVARRLLGPWSAALAGAIMALAPLLIYYSNETKQYSLDVLVTVLALCLFLYMRRPLTVVRAVVAALAGTALIWLSHPALFSLAAAGLVAFVETARRGDRRSVGWLIGVAVAWGASVALLTTFSLSSMVSNTFLLDFWDVGFMPAPWPPLPLLNWLWVKITELTWFTLQLTVVSVAGIVAAIPIIARRDRGLLAVLLLPIGLAFLASAVRLYPFVERLLLFTTPLVALLVGEGTVAIAQRLRPLGRLPAIGVVVALLAPMLLQTPDLLRNPQYKEELLPVMAHVAGSWQEGDHILLYYSSTHAFVYYQPRFGFENDDVTILERSRFDWGPYFQAVDEVIARGGRVWLIFSHVYTWGDVNEELLVLNYLAYRGFTPFDTFRQPDASAYLFILP